MRPDRVRDKKMQMFLKFREFVPAQCFQWHGNQPAKRAEEPGATLATLCGRRKYRFRSRAGSRRPKAILLP
jgi:hypothetical protein